MGSLLPLAEAHCATVDLHAGDSFAAAAKALRPGDTLIVHAGTYLDSGRVAITVQGTAGQPVVIKAADGESRPIIARRPTDRVENTIDIVGASYLTLDGLEITGNSGDGGDGVNLKGAPSYVTLQNLQIHNISVGINLRSSMHHITVRHNHIHHTYNTGEGLYVGCHDGDCAVSESLIEGNWIHDTRAAEQGDGIEIKKGSHSNVIRDNVIHDTRYPCIILYATSGHPANIVERNVMWNCDDSAIQVAADAVVRNNIFFANTGVGINSQPNNGVSPNNLQFINNTVIGGAPCLRIGGWARKRGMVFANNAVYCLSGDYLVGSMTGVNVSGNVFTPAIPAMPASGYKVGRSLSRDFVSAAAFDVYPTDDSPLLGTANDSLQPADDFNRSPRAMPGDVGAYDRSTAQNPGWSIGADFKDKSPPQLRRQ